MVEERVAAFNAHDVQRFAGFYAEDAVLSGPTYRHPVRGRGAIFRNEASFIAAFPDAHVEVSAVVVEGDVAGTQMRLQGTHTAPMATPHGTLLATGRRIAVSMVYVSRLGTRAEIVQERRYVDAAALLGQLGVT